MYTGPSSTSSSKQRINEQIAFSSQIAHAFAYPVYNRMIVIGTIKGIWNEKKKKAVFTILTYYDIPEYKT